MSLIDWIFPPRCLACRNFLENSTKELCSSCEHKWPILKSPHCPACAHLFSSDSDNHLCGDCLSAPKKCRRVYAAGIYEGVLHDLIIRLKYKSEERLGTFLGGKMAESIAAEFDMILPVPLHPKKLRERGFNQAVLLARSVSKKHGRPIDPFLLIKSVSTPAQADLKGEERRKNLKHVFEVRDPAKIKGKKILLIDDVYTTGTTIETITQCLLKSGAKEVSALVAARAV